MKPTAFEPLPGPVPAAADDPAAVTTVPATAGALVAGDESPLLPQAAATRLEARTMAARWPTGVRRDITLVPFWGTWDRSGRAPRTSWRTIGSASRRELEDLFESFGCFGRPLLSQHHQYGDDDEVGDGGE